MLSKQQQAEYRGMAATMMGVSPAEVPAGLLRRIGHVHELYKRHTAHVDLDSRTLLAAIVVEESGWVPCRNV